MSGQIGILDGEPERDIWVVETEHRICEIHCLQAAGDEDEPGQWTYTYTFDEPLPGWKRQDSMRRQLLVSDESQEAEDGDGIEFEGRWIAFDDSGDGRHPSGNWAGE